MSDLPPPNALIVCIETQPDYPSGWHMLTIPTLEMLGKLAADFRAQEAKRLELEAEVAKEIKGFKPPLHPPENEMGVLVRFKRDCQPEKKP